MPFNLQFLDNKHFRSVEREISVVRWCHIIQAFLAFIVILFSIIRIGTKNVSSRADTWTMSVVSWCLPSFLRFPLSQLLVLFLVFHTFNFHSQGLKTVVVLTYFLLVSRVERLKRFASLKTNMVLSSKSSRRGNVMETLHHRIYRLINSPPLGFYPVIELLFWIVAFFMTTSGIGKSRNNLAHGLAAVVIISDFILV